MTTGPNETEAQARETAAVQEIHRAFRADPDVGPDGPHINAMPMNACVMAGVELAESASTVRNGLPAALHGDGHTHSDWHIVLAAASP